MIQKWLHDKLGWGYWNGKVDKYSGCGCKYCDGVIEADSTGALFHLGRKFNKKYTNLTPIKQ